MLALNHLAAIVIGALKRRVADLETESAIRKGAVFVSSSHMLRPSRSTSEGTITAEEIDKDTLIDAHYGAIDANAMERSLGIRLCSKRHRTNFRRPSVSRGRTRWSRGWSTASSAKLGLSM